MTTRRQFIATGVAAAVGLPLSSYLYATQVEPHWLEISHHDLPVRALPPDLEGRTLAQLSDLHVGPQVDSDYVEEVFTRVRALAPDIVAYTGDFITYRGPQQLVELRRLLAGAPRGRIGTVAALGNHDYGFRWRMLEVADQLTSIAREAGITVLRNEAHEVAGLQFVGLEDLWGPRFGPRKLLTSTGDAGPRIALCHNPDAADRGVWGAFDGWILAGHTHGGQCRPPFLPPPLLPVANRRYTAGAFDVPGGRHLYVSRGVGHLIQARFLVRPEVPVFRLVRASATEGRT